MIVFIHDEKPNGETGRMLAIVSREEGTGDWTAEILATEDKDEARLWGRTAAGAVEQALLMLSHEGHR